MREVVKYLVRWKEFIAEHDSWKREEDLENTKEVVAEFEKKVNTEVRRQERLNMVEEKDFRRGELLGKYMAKRLYDWDDGRFENKYLSKLERNWKRWKRNNKMIWEEEASSFRVGTLKGREYQNYKCWT